VTRVRLTSLVARVDTLAHSRLAGPVVVVLSILAYWIQSLGWPLQRGRDSWDYLVFYLSYPDHHTPFQLVMLMRSPVTALALGLPLDVAGAHGLQVVMALAYVGTIVAWAAVARHFSGIAAAVAVALLLLNPVYALAFHEASSDFVAATLFSLYALAVVRAWNTPSIAGFAWVGGAVAALALARPAYQALILGLVLPLLAPGVTRDRLLRTGAFVACAVLPLVAWAVHNGIRYGDTTVSRAGKYNIPFYTAFRAGEIEADNGPRSAELGRLIERDVLTLPPYRALRVALPTYLDTRSNFEASRLAGLVDHVNGVGSDYGLLKRAALEVNGGGMRIAGVSVHRALDDSWSLASDNAGHENRLHQVKRPPPADWILIDGKKVPNPAVLGIPEHGESYGFVACAATAIDDCILAHPEERYHDPAVAERYREITRQVRAWDGEVGTGSPRPFVSDKLAGVIRRLPAPWWWAAIALVALAWRRPKGWPALLWLVLAAGGMLVVHAIGVGPDLFYALPVLPAWTVAAVCALMGRRRLRLQSEA
jgi:hypothetical protein